MTVYIATVVDNDSHIAFTDIKNSEKEARESMLGYLKGTIGTAIKNKTGIDAKDLDSPYPYACFSDGSKYYGEISEREFNPEDDGFFPITSVSREDLEEKGFDTSEVSDDTMRILASKLADDYCEQLFWPSLEIIAECLGIPLKGETGDEESD